MDLSQNMLGQMFGVSDQTIASWEKGVTKEVSGAGERLMRLLAEEALLKRDAVIYKTLVKLAELDRQIVVQMDFLETSSGWTAQAA
jgi:transcriptional regulator with XRE-family HTH domain